jgi:hypothetical protein
MKAGAACSHECASRLGHPKSLYRGEISRIIMVELVLMEM